MMDYIKYVIYWLCCTLTGSEPMRFKAWAAAQFIGWAKERAERYGKPEPAEIVYQDVTMRMGESGGVISGATEWTQVKIDLAPGDEITRLSWAAHDRLYVATKSGRVYMSCDQGLIFEEVLFSRMPTEVH